MSQGTKKSTNSVSSRKERFITLLVEFMFCFVSNEQENLNSPKEKMTQYQYPI